MGYLHKSLSEPATELNQPQENKEVVHQDWDQEFLNHSDFAGTGLYATLVYDIAEIFSLCL